MEEKGMLIFQTIILPIIVVIISLISAIIYNKEDKVDKGFAINYYKLSYRRKMIRDLLTLPIIIVGVIVVYFFSDWSFKIFIAFWVIVLLGYSLQLLYNYNMWKSKENK
jgi:hypothetical protein